MCGIAGSLSFHAQTPRDAVQRMVDAMASRGPDAEGLWQHDWVTFGHRRLGIIDLSERGRQPMVDEDLGLALVFNGCIYNHVELRAELSADFSFRSTSDTEVILKAYAKWGDDLVDHLHGMFAFALFDQRRNRVLLARDRLGVKPLYLAGVDGSLRFASSLPALLAGGGVDTAIDPVGLHHYLSWHSIVPAPRTILRGVTKLPPATVMVVEADGTRHQREYWHVDYSRDPDRADWSAEDWEEAVLDSLRGAVRRHLVADVPVGVLLSGGLDSSMLVALADEVATEPLDTFTIGFESVGSQAGDEFAYSDVIAERFGTRHQRIRVSNAELAEAVPRAVAAMTEPMASHDVTAFYLLSQFTAQSTKVVQSGQGADEVFGGYSYHQSAAHADHVDALAVFEDAFRDYTHDQVQRMVTPQLAVASDVSHHLLDSAMQRPGAQTATDAVLRLDTHLLMPDDPVKRVDSMSMAWGLEARVPFLDHELVELAAACPPELKAAEDGKGILKQVGRRIMPSAVIDRPKGYFPVPGLRTLGGPVLEQLRDLLGSQAARERGIIRDNVREAMLQDPNGMLDRRGGNTLWSLAVLEMWLQEHV